MLVEGVDAIIILLQIYTVVWLLAGTQSNKPSGDGQFCCPKIQFRGNFAFYPRKSPEGNECFFTAISLPCRSMVLPTLTYVLTQYSIRSPTTPTALKICVVVKISDAVRAQNGGWRTALFFASNSLCAEPNYAHQPSNLVPRPLSSFMQV